MLKHILQEHTREFDLNATTDLIHSITAEASDNASRPPEKRTRVALNKLKDELKPLMTTLNTDALVPNIVLAPLAKDAIIQKELSWSVPTPLMK